VAFALDFLLLRDLAQDFHENFVLHLEVLADGYQRSGDRLTVLSSQEGLE
jgi:hypothetical protein